MDRLHSGLPDHWLTQSFEVWRAKLRLHALPLGILAACLFGSGLWYSFDNLGISLNEFDRSALLATVLLMPLSVVYSGLGLVLLARCAETNIQLIRATTIASYATLSEALPLPGGAIVRIGALVAAGSKAGRSSFLVLLTAVLWISIATFGCGLALQSYGNATAWALLIAGGAGVLGTCGWMFVSVGATLALQTFVHRLAGIALIAVRLHFAFLCLGVSVPVIDTLPFALANIAGSAASITPSGLGISESLAALVAGTVNVTPTAAFIAVGLDRLACLLASAFAAFGGRRLRRADTETRA